MSNGDSPNRESPLAEEQVVDAIRQAIGELHKDDRERVFAIADRFRDEIRRDQLAGMAFALVGAELAAQP